MSIVAADSKNSLPRGPLAQRDTNEEFHQMARSSAEIRHSTDRYWLYAKLQRLSKWNHSKTRISNREIQQSGDAGKWIIRDGSFVIFSLWLSLLVTVILFSTQIWITSSLCVYPGLYVPCTHIYRLRHCDPAHFWDFLPHNIVCTYFRSPWCGHRRCSNSSLHLLWANLLSQRQSWQAAVKWIWLSNSCLLDRLLFVLFDKLELWRTRWLSLSDDFKFASADENSFGRHNVA